MVWFNDYPHQKSNHHTRNKEVIRKRSICPVWINQVQESYIYIQTFHAKTQAQKTRPEDENSGPNTVNEAVDCQWARTTTLQHESQKQRFFSLRVVVSLAGLASAASAIAREPPSPRFPILYPYTYSCGESKRNIKKARFKIGYTRRFSTKWLWQERGNRCGAHVSDKHLWRTGRRKRK